MALISRAKVYRALGVAAIVVLGLYLRIVAALAQPLWVDEAESAINALTILEHGLPVSHYLGLPLYENTLTESWPESREYEFRDSSYSPKGLAVYHGWLPLYAIAAAQALAGISPDRADPGEAPRVQHDDASVRVRTLAPRVPALVFSVGFMVLVYRLASGMAGNAAGFGALVWAAVSERAVLYGHQARYYSLTLLLCALFLHVYLRVHREGRVRDFVLLGVVTGLLFHTHQLSAVVACVTALAGLPRIMCHAHWLRNGLLSAGIVGLAVLPWAVLSGFFSTLSRVPKVFTLFQKLTDWFQYVLHHVGPAAIGAAGFALILGLTSRSSDVRGQPDRAALRERATILLVWAVLCLVAFHTLVPAASYFTGRLTLMLLTPYLILVSIAIGLICERISSRWAVGLSVAGVIFLLAAIGETDVRAKPLRESQKIEPALGALRALETKPGHRFYSPPNEHLVWTYYSGLPVQSIAPVRKTFLDSHPGAIILLERRFYDEFATPRQIVDAARAWGQAIASEQVETLRFDLWRRRMTDLLQKQGRVMEAAPVLPDFMGGVETAAADLSRRSAAAQMRYHASHPVFKGIRSADPAEQSLAFFYRFANPEKRLGRNANFHDRLQRAEVTLVPAAALAIYVSSSPVSP